MPKNIRVILIIRVQKSRVQAPRERPAANNVRAIRVRIKNRVKSACKNYSFNSFYSCSKNLVFKPPVSALAANKIRVIRAIRVRIKYRDKSV